MIKPRGHLLILGRTQTGKSTFAQILMRSWRGGVLVIDTQRRGGWPGIELGNRYSVPEVVEMLDRGYHLVWTPFPEDELTLRVLWSLCRAFLLHTFKNRILLIVDEAHAYSTNGARGPLDLIARQGLAHGVAFVLITQRAQDISKVPMTQVDETVIFSTSFDDDYLRSKKIPVEKLNNDLTGKDFHYDIWKDGQLVGPFVERV